MSEEFNNETFEENKNEEELTEAEQQAVQQEIHRMEEEAKIYKVIPDEPDKRVKDKNNMAGIICLVLILSLLMNVATGFIAVKIANSKTTSGNIVVYENNTPATTVVTTLNDISDIVTQVENSVVEVYTEEVVYSAFYGSYITEGAGSGVIFTEDGYIVTNNHVVEDARSVTVKLHSGKEYKAEVIATDQQTDLALIKIDAKNLQPATLGDSDALKAGQPCMAIGNPLGTLGGTVTTGIISALSRNIKIDNQEMTLLQTNTAISPGNSGGGLFDYSGNLIGIVNAKSSGESIEGIGFAIPVNDAKEVIFQLMQYGYVIGRPMLGIGCTSVESMQQIYQYGVRSYGVLVNKLLTDEAKESGLQENDLIIMIDEISISSLSDMRSALMNYIAGDTVTLTVLRENKKVTVELKLSQKRPISVDETDE